ncbi:MAG: DUF4058 family protein [Oculatellaceae cyanobacterium Prado106]|jgi:hypothetical protein|nr:DUF4058 family protein [Oculatellaceae cyanobacterium Prado106]
MDPYLEGYLWVDVHNALASKIRQLLVPKLRPRYTARLEIYLVEDPAPEAEVGILYPDVEIMQAQRERSTRLGESVMVTTPATLTVPLLNPVEIRIPVIEIRDTANSVLVTFIEILSPVNKREPGLSSYRQKQQRLRQAQVHLVEIDLLRRGTRPFDHPRLQDAYRVSLTRAEASTVDIWAISLWERLPILPIPLRSPDLDTSLDLQQALTEIYDEAGYDLSIDYTQSPPPPMLAAIDQQRLSEFLNPT